MSNDEIENIEKVIAYQIWRVQRYSPLIYDDMYQIAYLGYLTARKNYKKKHGKMTLQYAEQYIYSYLRRAIDKELSYQYKQVKFGKDENDHNEYLEEQPDPFEENKTANPLYKKIYRYLNCLTMKQRYIIEQFYFIRRNKSLKEIAADLDISVTSAHSIKKRGLDALRGMLNLEDYSL